MFIQCKKTTLNTDNIRYAHYEHGSCPQFGDRPKNQIFVPRPALLPKVRKNMIEYQDQPDQIVGKLISLLSLNSI